MDNTLLATSENALKELDRLYKFSNKYNIYPTGELEKILEALNTVTDALPDIPQPQNREELIQSEIKRRLSDVARDLGSTLNPREVFLDFDTFLQTYGIPSSDIEDLEKWLKANKGATLEAIERLYEIKKVENYDMGLSAADNPRVHEQVIKFAEEQVQKYHSELGKLVAGLTEVGEYLTKIKAAPTVKGRSYFQPLTNRLSLDISAICYMTEDGELHLKEQELIRIYGHEGMGHALNAVLTNLANLPKCLTMDSTSIRTTTESVAQFYEKRILEDLKDSSETQGELELENFDEIYREVMDTDLLQTYFKKSGLYGITVLADKSFGTPAGPETERKKIEVLNEVALTPDWAYKFVTGHRNRYDANGNFDPGILRELIYCTQSVERALTVFEKHGISYNEPEGRSLIDKTFLTGYWTAKGFEDNARLVAEEHSKKKKPQT